MTIEIFSKWHKTLRFNLVLIEIISWIVRRSLKIICDFFINFFIANKFKLWEDEWNEIIRTDMIWINYFMKDIAIMWKKILWGCDFHYAILQVDNSTIHKKTSFKKIPIEGRRRWKFSDRPLNWILNFFFENNQLKWSEKVRLILITAVNSRWLLWSWEK